MVVRRDFTDRFLRSIRPAAPGKRPIIYDAQVAGFGIRVDDRSCENNIGAFVLVTRFPGSPNATPRRIGDYPGTSLAKGRAIAREWREDIDRGVDPKAKAAEQRLEDERRRAETFAATFEQYAEDHLSTLRTGNAVRKAIENHVLPHWGNRPVSDIRRKDGNELLRNLRRDAPIGANRVRAYLVTFGGWLVDQDVIEASPFAALKRPSKENQRDRVLSEPEIRAIWTACGKSEIGAFGRAFKFMLATGQRRSEVGNLTWREIDLRQKLWTLPRERAKADRRHEIPLSALALSILEDCPRLGDFVFSATGARPVAAWSKPKRNLDRLACEKLKLELGDDAPAAIAEWHLHDLRRSCATYLAKLRVDRITISKILNHAEREVTSIYDRHSYDAEKRQAMDAWGARLAAIVDGRDGGNVVSLSPRRGRDHVQ
jgi:integrase